MISENVRPGVQRIVDNSDASNMRITVIPNTPLDHLVTEVIPVVTPTPGLEAEGVYQQADVTDITGINRHEMVLDEVINTIGAGLAEQVKIVRHEIIPMVRRVTAAAVDSANEVKLGEYTVEPFFLSEIHDNEIITELLEAWASFDLVEVASPIGFQPMDDQAVIQMADTGSTRLDGPMAEMIGKHPAGWAKAVYEDYFGVTGVKKFKAFNNLKSMDEWLLVHFLCRAFADNPQEGSGLSMQAHNSFCAALLAQTAVGMYNTHRSWDSLRSLGNVILSWPLSTDIPTSPEDAIIQVIGDTYNDFLGAGGSPEILIGACVTDRPYASTKLIEKSTEYAHAYSAYKTRQAFYRAGQMGGILRTRIYEEISNEIQTLPECLFSEGVPMATMISILRSMVGKFKDEFVVDNVYIVVREIICKVIYGHTDAYPILLDIDRVMKERDCTGREAMYYVSLERLATFWLNQTSIEFVD